MINCDCLKGLIKLRDLCGPNEECALYLDDLPNMSRAAIANFTDAERKCVADVFGTVESSAIAALNGQLKSVLASKMGRNMAEERAVTGRFKRSGNPIQADAKLSGKWIKTSASDYLEIYVESVRLWADDATTSNIYIFDTYTGELIEAIEYEAPGGCYFDVAINQSYRSKDGILIAYDMRDIVSRQIESFHQSMCNASHYEACCINHTSCGCNRCSCLEIDPDWDHQTDKLFIHPDSFCNASDCGMTICYRRRCTYENIICENQDKLCYLLWYQMGISFWEDGKLAKNVNAFTNIHPDERQSIIDTYIGHYNNHLAGFIEAIEPDGYCFQCRGTKFKNTIPG